jgi:hypothetical protein
VKTVTITVNKKTLLEVYNQVRMCNDLGFPNFQKGEPINNLMKEIKRDVKKQKNTSKPNIFVRLKNAIWNNYS